jgi:hypothetical protein
MLQLLDLLSMTLWSLMSFTSLQEYSNFSLQLLSGVLEPSDGPLTLRVYYLLRLQFALQLIVL